jgi:actin-like protein 6A
LIIYFWYPVKRIKASGIFGEMGDFTVVADIGTCCTRIGYAGSDLPQVWTSSALGVTTSNGGGSNTSVVKGQEELHFDLSHFREDMSVSHPLREGLIYNWDAYQAIWEGAIKNSIKVDMRETPVLLTEKPYVPPADRVK